MTGQTGLTGLPAARQSDAFPSEELPVFTNSNKKTSRPYCSSSQSQWVFHRDERQTKPGDVFLIYWRGFLFHCLHCRILCGETENQVVQASKEHEYEQLNLYNVCTSQTWPACFDGLGMNIVFFGMPWTFLSLQCLTFCHLFCLKHSFMLPPHVLGCVRTHTSEPNRKSQNQFIDIPRINFLSDGVFHLDGATAETWSHTYWLVCN